MNIFLNADLISVGISVAAVTILGFIVFFQNTKSATNIFFLLFSLTSSAWSVVNYLNYQVVNPVTALWIIRLVLFFAVFQSLTLLLLLYNFPSEKLQISPKRYYLLLILAFIVAMFTLTPFVFSSVIFTPGSVAQPVVQPGIMFFGAFAVTMVLGGIWSLGQKIKKATVLERKPLWNLMGGIIVMFACIIILNFILPTVFNNTSFIPLSAVFVFPFAFAAAYAIFRHHLLNVKVVSTEILVFVLAIATLFEVIISKDALAIVVRSSIFLLVLSVGILLGRSVIREVKQREELEVLSKELASANEQLKALDKARAEFISIASHQLRTPPATIKWYLGAVLNGDFGPLNDELKAALARTNVTNEAQISTIDDLLNASRIERGKLEFFFESFNLEPMVKTLVEQLEPLAQMKKQHLVYNSPTMPIPDIIVDHEKVRQVVNNMIDNAIKYSKVGDIQIYIMADDKNITVKVKDTGKGIEKSELEHVFSKYSRGKDSATHATGLGLGMYVAKVIIEQHNGKIWAESDGPGKGSTFAFSLPIKSDLKASTLDLAQEMAPEPAPTTEPEQKAV